MAGVEPTVRQVLAEARPPSRSAWRRIALALDAQTEPAGLVRDIAAIESACAHFPDFLRVAPGPWIRSLFDGKPDPRLRVARFLDISPCDAELAGDRLCWADAPELAHFTGVRVFDEQLGDRGLLRWLASENNRGVTDLALGAGITDRGAAQLSASSRVEQVRRLALFRNSLGPTGLSALLQAPCRALTQLLLGRNQLGEPGARALAGPTSLSGLACLDLDCNRLDGAAISQLAQAPLLAGVRALNLSNNPIGSDGCAALAASPCLGQLEALFLHGCSLDDAAVAHLLTAPWLPGVKNLALSENALSMATVDRIAACHALSLGELDICHNRFAHDRAEATLRAAPQLAGLRRLCL